MELNLILTQPVNNVPVDGYYDEETAWFTRFQIGSALEYDDPQSAILHIHKRHKERLDKFSRECQFDTPSGTQVGFVYSIRGVLEICRWSKQPKADMVMDALYDMAEEVIKKGYYSTMPDEQLAALLDEKINRDVNGKRLVRESRQQKSDMLFLERNKISHEDYVMQLRCIWGEDSYGFHKAFDDYIRWRNESKRGALA